MLLPHWLEGGWGLVRHIRWKITIIQMENNNNTIRKWWKITIMQLENGGK